MNVILPSLISLKRPANKFYLQAAQPLYWTAIGAAGIGSFQ